METTMQIMTVEQTQTRYGKFVEFSKSILKKDLDYGVIPGVNKPSLLKPGAEKLRIAYGLTVEMSRTDQTLDIDKDYYDVSYLATVKSRDGQVLSQCEGSANTYEDKYRYKSIQTDEKPENYDELVEKGLIKEIDMTNWVEKPKRSQQECDEMKKEGKGKWKKVEEKWVRYEADGKGK